MTDSNTRVSCITPDEFPPHDVIDAAEKVSEWFAWRNISGWRLGGCADRATSSKHHRDVALFMGVVGHDASQKNAVLYRELIDEEYRELVDAFDELRLIDEDQPNRLRNAAEDTLDALGDLIWVAYGMMLALGADPNRVWDEIAGANLAKIDPISRLVLKRADGKVIKPEGWKPPDHSEQAAIVCRTMGRA